MRWIVLLLGRDDEDPLFLQAKEAEASVLEPFAGASAFANHGQRVVEGQRLMQAASDIFLGWIRVDRTRRQCSATSTSASCGTGRARPTSTSMQPRGDGRSTGEVCGWTLARAHARSGDRVAIAAYLGSGDVFDQAMADFAEAYADQNERDYAVLADAVESGRIRAETGI